MVDHGLLKLGKVKLQIKGVYLCNSVQFSSVARSCPTLCDPMDCSTPGFLVYHQLPELTQTHAHRVGDAIQPSHSLSGCRYLCSCYHSNGRKWRGNKEPLGEESQKAGLKPNTKKNKIMASGPITSRQIEGGKVEAETDFIILGSKITVDSDRSHEIQRHLLLGRKAMTDLDSILKKERHYFYQQMFV